MAYYQSMIKAIALITLVIREYKAYSFSLDSNSTSQEYSSVVNLDNGDYYIFFDNSAQNSYSPKIYGKKFNYENLQIGDYKLSNSFYNSSYSVVFDNHIKEQFPNALYLFNNSFILIWQTTNSSQTSLDFFPNYNINAQIFDKDMNRIGSQIIITSSMTCSLSNKSIVKISKYLFAVTYNEYNQKTDNYFIIYNTFTFNGISIKKEILFESKIPFETKIQKLNSQNFYVYFLANEADLDSNGNLTSVNSSMLTKDKSPSKVLNVFLINHNSKDYDNYIINNNYNNKNLLYNFDNSYSNSINNNTVLSHLTNFNFSFNKINKIYKFKKYTTTNNFNIISFTNSKMLSYNSIYYSLYNLQNKDLTSNISANSIATSSNNTNLNYKNNTNINNPIQSSIGNTFNNTIINDINKENDLIAIISSYDNSTTGYNGFAMLNSLTNTYVQIDILDIEFNFLFSRFYNLENSCCFESLVLNDGSFILAWQYLIYSNTEGVQLNQLNLTHFNYDLNLKTNPKILLPELINHDKYKPRFYKFENFAKNYFPNQTADNFYINNTLAIPDKKIIINLNTHNPKNNYYRLFGAMLDCNSGSCKNELFLLDQCDKSCKSCLGNPIICNQCSTEYYPLYSGSTPLSVTSAVSNNIGYNLNDAYLYSIFDSGVISLNKSLVVNNSFNCFKLDNPPYSSLFDKDEMVFFKCDISCAECQGTISNCLKCNNKEDYYLLENSENKCINANQNYNSTSKKGYYLDKANMIMKYCNPECKTCTDSPDNCKECNNNDGYYSISETSFICKINPIGYYFDSIKKIYKKCMNNCIKCENANSCLVCDDYSSISKDMNKCYFCGEGMYFDEAKGLCSSCSDIGYCKSCEVTGCFECKDNFEFKPFDGQPGIDFNLQTNLKNYYVVSYSKYQNIRGGCNKCIFGYILISSNCESILVIVIPISILVFLIFFVIVIVIRCKRKSNNINIIANPNFQVSALSNGENNNTNNNRNRRILSSPNRLRNARKEKNFLKDLKPQNELHDAKCLFGDERQPFWLFDCGGYMCNQCSNKVVSQVKVKYKCPKCNKDLKNFKYLNRYVTKNIKENNNDDDNNTIIDLDDVNVSCENNNEIEIISKDSEKDKERYTLENAKINSENNLQKLEKEQNEKDFICNTENGDHPNDNDNINFNIYLGKNLNSEENKNFNNKEEINSNSKLRIEKKNNSRDTNDNNINNIPETRNIVCDKNNQNQEKKDGNVQTCQICFVLKSTKIINCESATPHILCSYCYNRMLKIDKVKVCPFCKTKIKKI